MPPCPPTRSSHHLLLDQQVKHKHHIIAACCLPRVQDAELAAARRELEVLVERMFAAPAWRASPRLNVLGDSMRVLEGQAAEVSAGVGTDRGIGGWGVPRQTRRGPAAGVW